GEKIADQRYLPFGEERWNAVDLPNDRGYTGQRNEKHNTHYVVQGFGLAGLQRPLLLGLFRTVRQRRYPPARSCGCEGVR
ncbi:MAG TPA: hypothetical protein VIO61_05875, partial [Anaerolineaceae bacterium]